MIEILTEKKCTKCSETKNISEFYCSKGKYESACKACKSQYAKNNRDKINESNRRREANNPEKYKEKNKIYYQKDKAKILANNKTPKVRFAALKYRAKKKMLDVVISFDEYSKIILEPCYYCNYELGTPVESGCGLDRLDSNKGYTIDNIVSCCSTCNILKGDLLSPEETKLAAQIVLNIRKRTV